MNEVWRVPKFREYSRAEIMADGFIHLIGICASITAVALLLAFAVPALNVTSVTGLGIYSATLIAMFSFSAAYNLIPHPPLKPFLRKLDQAGIFLKIAGTYTPFVILIDSTYSYSVLAVIWVTALAGAIAKLVLPPRRDRYSVPLYLALGWASIVLAIPIVEVVPIVDAWLILAGGLLYSAGVIFHVWDSLKFQNAIWHGFVLAAAFCHFAALSHASFAAGL